MKCCICKEQIKREADGWTQGNNAQPVKEGRCCDKCNLMVVIPERLKRLDKLSK